MSDGTTDGACSFQGAFAYLHPPPPSRDLVATLPVTPASLTRMTGGSEDPRTPNAALLLFGTTQPVAHDRIIPRDRSSSRSSVLNGAAMMRVVRFSLLHSVSSWARFAQQSSVVVLLVTRLKTTKASNSRSHMFLAIHD